MVIHPCLAQPSLQKLPLAAGTNKYRDSRPDNTQRVRDFGTLSLKRYVSTKYLLSGIKALCRKGGRGDTRTRGGGPKGIKAL